MKSALKTSQSHFCLWKNHSSRNLKYPDSRLRIFICSLLLGLHSCGTLQNPDPRITTQKIPTKNFHCSSSTPMLDSDIYSLLPLQLASIAAIFLLNFWTSWSAFWYMPQISMPIYFQLRLFKRFRWGQCAPHQTVYLPYCTVPRVIEYLSKGWTINLVVSYSIIIADWNYQLFTASKRYARYRIEHQFYYHYQCTAKTRCSLHLMCFYTESYNFLCEIL